MQVELSQVELFFNLICPDDESLSKLRIFFLASSLMLLLLINVAMS